VGDAARQVDDYIMDIRHPYQGSDLVGMRTGGVNWRMLNQVGQAGCGHRDGSRRCRILRMFGGGRRSPINYKFFWETL